MEESNLIDIIQAPRDRFAKIKHWELDDINLCLLIRSPEDCGYDVPLANLRSSAVILDWIAQVSKKSFISKEVLGDFVQALDAALNLQANYCSSGIERGLKTKSEIMVIVENNIGQYRWKPECKPMDSGR